MPLAFKGYQIRKHVFSFIGKTKKRLAYIVHTADHERHNSDTGIDYGVRLRITQQTQFLVTAEAQISAMFGPKI